MSLHDVRDVNTQMDTSPIQSLAYSTRVLPCSEDPLLQNAMPRPTHDQPPIFQRQVDPNSLRHPLPDSSSSSTGLLSMEPRTSSRAPAPGFISDFPSQIIPFATSSRMDAHLPLHSPQSASPGSGGPSSTVHAISSAYSMSNQSIMSNPPPIVHPVHAQSALGSSPSSANLVSELRFSPLNNSQSKPGQDSGFVFPPPDVADSRFSARDSSPETPGDSHLLVVGDMLKTCVPLSSARQLRIFILFYIVLHTPHNQQVQHVPVARVSKPTSGLMNLRRLSLSFPNSSLPRK